MGFIFDDVRGIPKSEVDQLSAWWQALPGLRAALFATANEHAVSLRVDDLTQAVAENDAVRAYVRNYKDAFSGLRRKLVGGLIGNWETVDSLGEEESIAEAVFECVAPFELVDKYGAFQVLDDAWKDISADLRCCKARALRLCGRLTL